MSRMRETLPGVVCIDVHGMNCYQAGVRINAALSRTGGVYRIRVIHGYRRGTAIRDFVRETYAGDPRVRRLDLSMPGSTDLVIRELTGE